MARPKILVVDRGAFLCFAQALAADADVFYWSEWREVAPSSKNAMVGRDVPGITRADSMWKVINDVDTIAFPDVGDGDMQAWLRTKGYAVWGTGDAELMELDRGEFKRLLKQLGQPVIETRTVVGLTALRRILEREEDLYLKTSWFRNDMETRHHETWHLSEQWFFKMWHQLGPRREEIEILVEYPMPGCEIGYEGYVVDGQFPDRCAFGLEKKDKLYLGRAVDTDDLPACLADSNRVLAEPLRMMGARGNYHMEVRIADDGTAYPNDPCLRCGSPPFGAMSLWITNWVEIVTAGARGEMVTPEFAEEYACEIELESAELMVDWVALEIAPESEPWVRLRRTCVVDDQWWGIPNPWLNIAGSAVGLGSTPEEAIDRALEVADGVKGQGIVYDKDSKDEMLKDWQSALEACEVA